VTVYQWRTDDDDVALDAIIIGIGSDEKAFSAAGIDYREVLASIYRPDWISQGERIKAALEGHTRLKKCSSVRIASATFGQSRCHCPSGKVIVAAEVGGVG
jgi:hypothetical protein